MSGILVNLPENQSIHPDTVRRLMRARAEAIHRDYDAFTGIDRGVCAFYHWGLRRWVRRRVIDIGRRPDVSRSAATLTSDDGAVPDAPPPSPTMRTVLEWFVANGNAPATNDQIADGIGRPAPRLRYIIGHQGDRYLRKVGSIATSTRGGRASWLYCAIAPDAHLAIPEPSTPERVIAWFTERDNQPAAADDIASDLGLSPKTLRVLMNQDQRFCDAGKATGPNGGRARNLYQVA